MLRLCTGLCLGHDGWQSTPFCLAVGHNRVFLNPLGIPFLSRGGNAIGGVVDVEYSGKF